MSRFTLGLGLTAWMLVTLTASGLSARQPLDLCRIEAEADAIRCLADELRPELRDHFHCSCLFRELNRARNDVESAARRVRSAARSRHRVCDLPQEVACLAEQVHDLSYLIERARNTRRDFGPRGLDFACADRVERILAEMCHRTALLEALVNRPLWGRHWELGWGTNAVYSGPTGLGYSGPTGLGYSGPTGLGYSGPTGFDGTNLRGEQVGAAIALPRGASSGGRVSQPNRASERSRTVTRSRAGQTRAGDR